MAPLAPRVRARRRTTSANTSPVAASRPPPRPPHLCLPAACSQQYDRATGSNESDPAYQGALTNYVQNWGTHYVWRAWAGRMRSQAMLMST